jgi:hypothetical protein
MRLPRPDRQWIDLVGLHRRDAILIFVARLRQSGMMRRPVSGAHAGTDRLDDYFGDSVSSSRAEKIRSPWARWGAGAHDASADAGIVAVGQTLQLFNSTARHRVAPTFNGVPRKSATRRSSSLIGKEPMLDFRRSGRRPCE